MPNPLLGKVTLFAGLNEKELEQIEAVCQDRVAGKGELLIQQNTMGDEMYIIAEGGVEVFIEGLTDQRTLVLLGEGQVVGEMALIDSGYRSASARAAEQGCHYFALGRDNFNKLCQENSRIGFIVMRNIASDVAFKLRHRNLMEL